MATILMHQFSELLCVKQLPTCILNLLINAPLSVVCIVVFLGMSYRLVNI